MPSTCGSQDHCQHPPSRGGKIRDSSPCRKSYRLGQHHSLSPIILLDLVICYTVASKNSGDSSLAEEPGGKGNGLMRSFSRSVAVAKEASIFSPLEMLTGVL